MRKLSLRHFLLPAYFVLEMPTDRYIFMGPVTALRNYEKRESPKHKKPSHSDFVVEEMEFPVLTLLKISLEPINKV